MEPNNYLNIEGHFNFEAIYRDAVMSASDGDVFLEVGCWLGRSACYMAEMIKQSKKRITFHVLDTFLGEDMTSNKTDFYDVFIKNMEKAGVVDFVTPHIVDSHSGANIFENESLKFIFIDANHQYEFVKKDIELYYPKVKDGGTIAGHDTQAEGVRKAIDEFFIEKQKNISYYENSWIHKKENK